MTGRSTGPASDAASAGPHNGVEHPAPNRTTYAVAETLGLEQSLVARILQRDEQALGLLYDRYGALIYTIALRVVHDRAAAEEVVQDVFQVAWRSVGGWHPGGSLAAWLIGIARNRAIDALRARGNRTHDRAMIFDTAQNANTMGMALRALPAGQREAFELAYYGGLTRAAIAARMNQSPSTVKRSLRQALVTLHQWLGHSAEDPG